MKPAKLTSLPTIKRLPSYLLVVEAAARAGDEYISGTVIANELELEPIQVRKDLAVTGVTGTPRRGFPVRPLIEAINDFLGWNRERRAILVGTGNLGTALLGYPEFRRHGLRVVAAFDAEPTKQGTTVNGVFVYPAEEIANVVKREKPELAILTVPSDSAQAVAQTLMVAGIRSIWNFTNTKLKTPPEVIVQKEDLSSGLAVLCVKMRQPDVPRS